MLRNRRARESLQPVSSSSGEVRLAAFGERLRTSKKWRRRVFGYSIVLAPVVLYYLLLVAHLVPRLPLAILWTLLIICISGLPVCYAEYMSGRAKHRAANELADMGGDLRKVDDLRVVGPLAEALVDQNPARSVAATALMKLLPRLTEDDASVLNARQRAALYRMLQVQFAMRHADVLAEFVLIILEAMTKVGDGRALSYAEKLAEYDAKTYQQRRIQMQVRACLPRFRALAEQERRGDTLLRPSRVPEPSAQTYLRPARNTPEADPEKLLRANLSDGSAERPGE